MRHAVPVNSQATLAVTLAEVLQRDLSRPAAASRRGAQVKRVAAVGAIRVDCCLLASAPMI